MVVGGAWLVGTGSGTDDLAGRLRAAELHPRPQPLFYTLLNRSPLKGYWGWGAAAPSGGGFQAISVLNK